ncbi:MAG: capsular exopolysaccharide family, partial [Segetibacter sp.]|nr:capsular exopolysaccharide family [Segetibacter sp.]
ENEIEVIQSKGLLADVVNHLHLYAPVSEQRSFKTVSAYTSSPVIIVVEKFNNYRETKKVPFTYNANNSTVLVGRSTYPLNTFVSTPFGSLKFAPNPRYIGGGSNQFFFELQTPKAVINSIAARLTVLASSKQSSIIDLSFKDEIPQRGEDIVNDLLSTYNTAAINDKNALAKNTLNFIDERLKYVKHDLDSIERKIEKFKARQGAVDISTEGKLYLESVSANDQKLSEVNLQIAVLDQVERYVLAKDKAEGVVPATMGVNDPMLSRLVERLYNAELEYESLKKTTGENSPILLSLSNQIQKIKPGILENIQNQRRSLLASRSNLASTNGAYSSALQRMPQKERQLIDINREQGNKNEIYNFLLQKREETALSHAATVSDSRIVDRAQSSDSPVSPKRKVVYFSSLLLALFSGIGIVMGKETLSRKIMFRHEVENMTDFPIIGEIAAEATKNPIVVGEGKKTFIAEQFRKLRATLSYMGINSSTKKKILVTSSISGEGKSFIATNLALSLAITGKKVALLDFDLNNPSLNNKLSVSKQIGITEYLKGECKIEEIIKATDLHKHLFLVPTGELPDNPAELIMSGGVEELLNYMTANFDYVVIDTAPVGPVTDAYLLSPLCDATLFIVRHNYTPKTLVGRIDLNNRINKLSNMAIVFNGITTRGYSNYSYGYGYGYGNVYGYVDNKKTTKFLGASKN